MNAHPEPDPFRLFASESAGRFSRALGAALGLRQCREFYRGSQWLKAAARRCAVKGDRQERLRRTAQQLSRQCDDLKRRMLAARENR